MSKRVNGKGSAKHPWTEDEDETLRRVVGSRTTESWSEIAKLFADRTGKQCRERWNNHLDPNVKKGPWTEDEDQTIFELHKLHGNQWALIAGQLNGRTDNQVKNRYYATLRRYKRRTANASLNPVSRKRKTELTAVEVARERAAKLLADNGGIPVGAETDGTGGVSTAVEYPGSTSPKHGPAVALSAGQKAAVSMQDPLLRMKMIDAAAEVLQSMTRVGQRGPAHFAQRLDPEIGVGQVESATAAAGGGVEGDHTALEALTAGHAKEMTEYLREQAALQGLRGVPQHPPQSKAAFGNHIVSQLHHLAQAKRKTPAAQSPVRKAQKLAESWPDTVSDTAPLGHPSSASASSPGRGGVHGEASIMQNLQYIGPLINLYTHQFMGLLQAFPDHASAIADVASQRLTAAAKSGRQQMQHHPVSSQPASSSAGAGSAWAPPFQSRLAPVLPSMQHVVQSASQRSGELGSGSRNSVGQLGRELGLSLSNVHEPYEADGMDSLGHGAALPSLNMLTSSRGGGGFSGLSSFGGASMGGNFFSPSMVSMTDGVTGNTPCMFSVDSTSQNMSYPGVTRNDGRPSNSDGDDR